MMKKPKYQLKFKVKYNIHNPETDQNETREGIISGIQIILKPKEQYTRYMFYNTGDLVNESDIVRKLK